MRFLTMIKSAERSEPPPQALMDGIAKLGQDAARAGVLVETGGLMPSAAGARIKLRGGKVTVTDGPFTESKEVIGGYAIYDVPSKQAAMEWTLRFAELHRRHTDWDCEIELRQLFDPAASGRPVPNG